METKFKLADPILEQLVNARREQVVQSQIAQANQLKELEFRSQSRMETVKNTLPKDLVSAFESLDKTHEDEVAATKAHVDRVKSRLLNSHLSPENETAVHPGLAGGKLVAPSLVGWFTPYYGVLHGADGTIHWEGTSGFDDINLGFVTNGSGSGYFGGTQSAHLIMDWWFTYNAPENRNYSHTISVPYHGFYIVYANDGFWDDKAAHVRIDLSATGYQYNTKPTSTTNVLDMHGQNINVNDRLDGERTMYYSTLLGADQAYLRVSSSFSGYARGGGSTAHLNFADGAANYIGLPWVRVD